MEVIGEEFEVSLMQEDDATVSICQELALSLKINGGLVSKRLTIPLRQETSPQPKLQKTKPTLSKPSPKSCPHP